MEVKFFEAVNQPRIIGSARRRQRKWKYNPSVYTSDEMVDIVSLVQSLKEVEDERVEMQIEEIMEEYKW